MVNIVIKTLKNQKLDLEVQDDDTIEDIKKKINEQHKLGPPESQKLIHRGKILQNQSTVKEIGFKEKDFVVVMVKKAKPKVKTSKTSTQQTTETTTTSNTNTSTTTNTNTSNNNNNNNNTSTTTTTDTSNNNNPNNENIKKILDETTNILSVTEMITGIENVDRCIKMLQEKVNEIISPRKVTEEDCRIALRAAFNFPQRAGNILFDEEQLNIEKVKFQQTRTQPPPQTSNTGNTGNTTGTGNNPLPTGNPTGNPLQGLGGGNQLLNLIGQLARTNPDLMRAIQNDPQALQRALQDPQLIQQLMSVMILQRMQQEQQGGNQQGNQQQQGQPNQTGLGGLGGQQQGQPPPNQPGVIRISQEDQEKIKQVMEFSGCQHRDAAEAYFACDKSVELAVNYVLTEQSSSRLQQFQQPTTTTTTTTTTSTTQPQQQQQQEEQPKNDEEKPKNDEEKPKN